MRIGLIHGVGNVWFWLPDPDAMSGTKIGDDARSLFRQFLDSGQNSKVIQGQSLLTGVMHIVAFTTIHPITTVADNPLILSLSRATQVVFADWRKQLWINLAIFLVASFLLLLLILVQGKRRILLQKRLAVAEASRIKAENKLRDEHQSLLEVVRAADAGIYDWNLHTNRIQINERWAGLIGYKKYELEPLSLESWRHLIHPDDVAELDTMLQKVVRGQRDFAECQLRMRHKNGEWIWLLNRTSVVEIDADNQALRVSGVHLDVTERHQAEMMTQRAFHYARSLLEASLDPVAAINADGQITDVNQAAVMATGVERDELIGTDFSSYFTEPHKARKTYQEVFAQGTVRDYPLILRHRSGATIDVLYNASVYHDQNNEVAGVLAVARDITQLRRSQLELQQKNHEILLLADLNNLLQSCNVTGEAFPIIVAAMQKLFPDSTGRCFMLE